MKTIEYLKKNGYTKVKAEENYVDIKCIDYAKFIVELV